MSCRHHPEGDDWIGCVSSAGQEIHTMKRDNPCVMSTERGKSTGHTDRGINCLEGFGLVAQPEDNLRNLCYCM
jgi:hypothetical protein